MVWKPIAESGIGFTQSLPDGVTLTGSTITCVRLGLPEDQAWSIQLAKACLIRVTFLFFDSSGYGQSGYFMFNGQIVDNQGGADEWIPNPVESPSEAAIVVYTPGEQSDYPQDSYTALIEVSAEAVCEEIGRVTRNYVSAHQRDRVHYGRLYAPEVRCLVTNFNGAIPPGRSIVSASWQTWDNQVVVMASPKVQARAVEVTIRAQYTGRARILVSATLDNGEVYTAWHVVRVQPAPYFDGSQNWQTGPQRLEAFA